MHDAGILKKVGQSAPGDPAAGTVVRDGSVRLPDVAHGGTGNATGRQEMRRSHSSIYSRVESKLDGTATQTVRS